MVREEGELVRETEERINSVLASDPGRLFAVVHLRGHQHKVTTGDSSDLSNCSNLSHFPPGDLVMVLTDLGAPLGARIRLEKLLALGSRDFTLLGRSHQKEN
jgi:large subunit ribosomal protein L21